MTADQLGKLLEGLGYQPQAYKNKDGNVSGYSVNKITDSTGNWYMNFDLSKDGKWHLGDNGPDPDHGLLRRFRPRRWPSSSRRMKPSNQAIPYFAMYQDNWVVLELSENTNLLTPQWLREDIEIVSQRGEEDG